MNYDWPGNVRDLENAVERALVLGVSDAIRPEDLPELVLERAGREIPRRGQALKRQLILLSWTVPRGIAPRPPNPGLQITK